ncbi:MAG: 5-formyltetrahydrofolate cyclo-ligase [Burkholderiales bacterium]
MTATRATAKTEESGHLPADRVALRRRLLAAREHFADDANAAAAQRALTGQLARLLRELEPAILGLYWPLRGEFNPCDALEPAGCVSLTLALPYARREPREMHYRTWNGHAPDAVDECGVPAPAAGAVVVPDVVLVPCVGFTRSGWRLGYGGGYFDRWLALHSHVVAVGVAWSASEITEADWSTQPHDQPLAVIVTEAGVVS